MDSDDIEDNDASDMDISGIENRDDSGDSDYYGTAKDKAEAKRKKARASRAERTAKRERAKAEAAHMLLGDKVNAMLKVMRRKEKEEKKVVFFDPEEIKKEVKDIPIEAAIPIFLGLGIIERGEDDEDGDATFTWHGFNHEETKEKLVSILSEEDEDLSKYQDQIKEDPDIKKEDQDQVMEEQQPKAGADMAWIMCKKALRIVLKLPPGQAIATGEVFRLIGGNYDAEDSQAMLEKVDHYSKMSTALRVLQVRQNFETVCLLG